MTNGVGPNKDRPARQLLEAAEQSNGMDGGGVPSGNRDNK